MGRPGEAIFVVRRIVLAICADRAALGLVAALLIVAPPVCAKPVAVVAAENFYGDIARQIGGPQTAVTSIISNPDKDPHEFEPGPASARMLAEAQLVIYNGADYDPWVAKLLSASSSPSVAVIDVAALANKKPGDNPHIWYDLNAVGALASHYVAALDRLDPPHAADYRRRLERFAASLSAQGPGCRASPQIFRNPRHRDRTGVWLYGRCLGARHAKPALSAGGHERHRAQRLGYRRIRT